MDNKIIKNVSIRLLILIALFSTSIAADSCNASVDSDLTLTSNVNATGNSSCFNMSTVGITLDCDGYLIYSDATGNAINIGAANVTVKNCRITNFSTGVYFSNTSASNDIASNNTVWNNSLYGIHLDNAGYNNISHNNASYNLQYGFYLTGSSTNNNLSWNTMASNTRHGVYFNSDTGDYNTITHNSLYFNDMYGIYLISGDFNNVSYNNVSYNTQHGGYLAGTATNNNFSRNNVTGNSVGSTSYHGIYLASNVNYNTFDHNTIDSNGRHGIYVSYANFNEFSYNNVSYSNEYGVYLIGTATNNNVSRNTLMRNTYDGIYLEGNGVDYNTIGHNKIYLNNRHGIGVAYADNNNVSHNNISDNTQDGIYLIGSLTNNFSWNIIFDNSKGITLSSNADSNTFWNNSIYDNSNIGVHFWAGGDSNIFYNNSINQSSCLNLTANADDNSFYHNYFYNGLNNYVGDAGSNNEYNTTIGGITQGNYYDDILNWIIFDSDADGFGDSGVDLPYNSSQTKWFGVGEDYAPMTNRAMTYYIESYLVSPSNNTEFIAGSTISLQSRCETNATLTGAKSWLWYANGTLIQSMDNTSSIVNATPFTINFVSDSNAIGTYYLWNTQCNYSNNNSNASSNWTFELVSAPSSGGSSNSQSLCSSNDDCPTNYYCSESNSRICVYCSHNADGICSICAIKLGLNDPDCNNMEETTPTAEPTITPTQEPESTIKPTTQSTIKPTEEPVEKKGVTYAEALAEIKEAQLIQDTPPNEEAQELINLAMAALETDEFEQAKAYAQQAQSILLTTKTREANFDGILLPITALLIIILGAIAYFSTIKKA